MKIHHYISMGLVLLFATMIISRVHAETGQHLVDEKAIDAYIQNRMQTGHFPGVAVAIVKDDQVVYMKGYGRADSTGRPMTPQTSFIIGSITKPFTDMAVMQLVEAGTVDLDAPVQRYLTWFKVADPAASGQITIRMLIDQTSGLPQAPTFVTWNWPDTPDAIERHVRLLAGTKLLSPPGKTFAYSNANSVVLGMIIQNVSGLSYEEYIQQHFFTPLDMKNSFVSQAEAKQHGMAQGYRWWFGYPVPFDAPYNRANLPAGFIISSAEDMAHFLIAQLNGGSFQGQSILSAETIASMQVMPEDGSGFGMGWQFAKLNGQTVLHFEGGPANYQASIFFDPQRRVGVFVASNVINALDVLSSAGSSGFLDGISTRVMAESVLSMATNQTLPGQGIGIQRLTLIANLLMLVLTGLQAVSFLRIPRKNHRFQMRGIGSRTDLNWQIGKSIILHFAWPLALAAVALMLPNWIIIVLFQPDIVLWLYVMAALTALKGALEIIFTLRAYRKTNLVPSDARLDA